MALKTLEEQLEGVQKAIAKIETGGQGYGIAGRSVTRAEYNSLITREKQLKVSILRQKQGSIAGYRYFISE